MAITITHKITAKKCATTLQMPGRSITKTWTLQKDNSFVQSDPKGWDDEGLPDEILWEVERAPTSLCDLLD